MLSSRLPQACWRLSKSASWVIAVLLSLSASGAHAAVTGLQAGMLASGTAPFDGAAGPGNDTSGSDAIIRTHDTALYKVEYTLNPQDTGARLTLTIGATTLPPTYVGPANPQIAYFTVADLPTGPSGCQNIQTTALTAADLTAGTKSGVSADGQTLVCVQPSPIAFGRDLNFRMRISGSAPNGATVAPPTVTLQSANNAATSTVAALNDGTTLMPDLWHPALSLIWPWHVQKVHRGLLPAPPPTAEALAVWRTRCTELLVEPSRFANAMHLTTCAKEALVASGMQRVLIFMADRALSTLRVHQADGLPKDAAHLSLDVVNSTLLQRLLEKSAQVRLTPDNHAQFSALLPPILRRLFIGEHLLLRSLSCNGRVVMLIVADQGGGPFSETTVQAFGKTAQCIEKALHSFTNRSA